FLLSPFIAPEVAIAAETPKMETALASMRDISLSIFNFLHNQKAKYQTEITTTNACTKPRVPAFKISLNKTVVPNNTKPILTYSSVLSAFLNHSGNLMVLLINNPMPKAKITASRLYSFTLAFPAKINASNVNKKTTGNTTNSARIDLLRSRAARMAVIYTIRNWLPTFVKLDSERTFSANSEEADQLKLGLGTRKPSKAIKISPRPRTTTVQSSLKVIFLVHIIVVGLFLG